MFFRNNYLDGPQKQNLGEKINHKDGKKTNSNVSHEKSFFDSSTVWTIAVLLGCLQEREGNILLLKTTHTLDVEHGRIYLNPTWKSPSWGLALCYQKVLCKLSWDRSKSPEQWESLLRSTMTNLATYPEWYNSGNFYCGCNQQLSN